MNYYSQMVHEHGANANTLAHVCAEVERLRAALAASEQARAEAVANFEDAAILIKRLCRRCYALGWKGKLTEQAMDYINRKGAKCSPLRELMERVTAPASEQPERREGL